MSTAESLFEVRMLATPLLLRERSRQQGADLLREMVLLRSGSSAWVDGDGHHLPARLLELAQELDTIYAPYIAASSEQMDEALDAGQDSLDVTYRLPTGAVAFVQHLAQVLAEVEGYCRADQYLLTLAPAPDIAAYRAWSIGEVVRQAAGQPATPWPRYAQEHLV